MKKIFFTLLMPFTALFLLPYNMSGQGHWDSLATRGFNYPANYRNTCMDTLRGEIYVSSGTSMGTNYMFRSTTGAYGSWVNDPVYIANVSPNVNQVTSMASTGLGGGFIFTGHDNYPNGVNVYQCDGTNWAQFGNIPYTPPPTNMNSVSSMTFFTMNGSNDTLYAALEDQTDGAQLWKTPYNLPNWTMAANFGTTAGRLNDLTVWGDTLYTITNTGLLMQSRDGMNWIVNTNVDTNFSDPYNYFTAMTVFNGDLYIGTDNYNTGAQLWKSSDGVTWTAVTMDGFNNPGNVFRINDLKSAYGKLWVISEAYTAGGNLQHGPSTQGGTYWSYVHYSSDGVTFTGDINNGFDPNNIMSRMAGPMTLAGFNYHVIATGQNYSGAETWGTCVPPVAGISAATSTTCTNTAVSFTNTTVGANSYVWKVNGNVMGTSANFMYTPSVSGNFTITMIAYNDSCVDSTSVPLTVFASPTVNVGPDITTCNDSLLLIATVAGGQAPYAYLWSCGTTTDSVLFTPPGTGPESIIVTDANGCSAFDTTNITTIPAPTIAGNVTINSNPVTSGWVYLVHRYPYLWHQYPVDSVQINNGIYTFNTSDTGNFILYARVDTSIYPLAIKTYHDSATQWNNAVVENFQCSTNYINKNIYVKQQIVSNGQGNMSGKIVEDAGYQRMIYTPGVQTPGDPIPDIDVTLKQNPGGALITNTTNSSGQYNFSNVPPGTYDVVVDIPGIGQISQYTRTITSNENYVNLDYRVDSVHVFIDPSASVHNLANNENALDVYPVPSNGTIYIEYTTGHDAQVKLEVLDVLGNSVKTFVSGEQQKGTYKYSFNTAACGLSHGIYFVRLGVDGAVQTKKVISIQ